MPSPAAVAIMRAPVAPMTARPQGYNTEEYRELQENPFLKTLENPRFTFSIGVDTASTRTSAGS